MNKETFEEKVKLAENLIYSRHGMVRTREFTEAGISYKVLLRMVEEAILVRAKSGYYTLKDGNFSEEEILCTLYGDGVLTMESALYLHGYVEQKPEEWQLAISKNTSKSRFLNPPIAIEPYYTEERVLPIGAEEMVLFEGVAEYKKEAAVGKEDISAKEGVDKKICLSMRVYGIDRLICDVLKYEEKLDRENYKAAIRAYIADEKKDVAKLLVYAKERKVLKKVQGIIGVWL